jgi:hypothetical protein
LADRRIQRLGERLRRIVQDLKDLPIPGHPQPSTEPL